MFKKHCPVWKCTNERKQHHAMCAEHWAMVPKDLQKRIYDTWWSRELREQWAYAFGAALRDVNAQVGAPDGMSRRYAPAAGEE